MKLFPAALATISIASVAFFAAQQPETTEPSRVLLSWNGDPATQAAISWRTDKPSQQTIQFRIASADPRDYQTITTQPATSSPLELAEDKTAYYHTATLANLIPNTKYSYRVGDGTTFSEWFDFKTASDQPKPFSFIYFGDAQNDVKSMWSRVIRQAQKDAPYADFMLHAGDLINIAEADNEWRDWFYAGGWLHSTIPSIATPGNHEYKSGKITRLWQPQFEYPRNGVPGLEDSNYYIDYQGSRIISLNSLEKTAEQADWLDKVLFETKADWTILTFHYPMYSTAKGRDNKALRELWLPIILKHKVDLVLQGHDHAYGRMSLENEAPLTPGEGLREGHSRQLLDDPQPLWETPSNIPFGTAAKQGSTYFVVSVSGPKMYNLGEEALAKMDKTAEYKQLYQVISVTPTQLKYKAHLATGELYDTFEINK